VSGSAGLAAGDTDTFTDEPEVTHLGGSRPYLRIAAVLVVALAILGVGYFGPHASGPAATPLIASASTAPVASASGGDAPGPSEPPVVIPLPSAAPASPADQLAERTGLSHLTGVAGSSATQLLLPVTSRSPAIVGSTLYYIAGGDEIVANALGSATGPTTLVSVPHCQAITDVAAGAGYVVYVVSFANIPAATVGGCDGFGQVAWSVRTLDLATGRTMVIAGGIRRKSGVLTIGVPVHVAASGDAFAFDRPGAATDEGGGETVEVHSFDGSLRWSVATSEPVVDVLLAADKLAVVTQAGRAATPARTLWLASATHRRLEEIAQPASSASISADGHFLAWDSVADPGFPGESGGPDVGVANTASGAVGYLSTPTSASAPGAADPRVFVTSRGVLITWLTTAPDGSVYPAFNWLGGGWGFIETAQQPLWIAVQGETLVWVTEAADDQAATMFAAALSGI
jgi:hypothetical protein